MTIKTSIHLHAFVFSILMNDYVVMYSCYHCIVFHWSIQLDSCKCVSINLLYFTLHAIKQHLNNVSESDLQPQTSCDAELGSQKPRSIWRQAAELAGSSRRLVNDCPALRRRVHVTAAWRFPLSLGTADNTSESQLMPPVCSTFVIRATAWG